MGDVQVRKRDQVTTHCQSFRFPKTSASASCIERHVSCAANTLIKSSIDKEHAVQVIGIDLLLRWAHLLAASIFIGGSFYVRCVQLPNLSPEGWSSQRSSLAKLMRIAGGVLIVSGLINAVRLIQRYEFIDAPYHGLVAGKLLLAIVAVGLVDRLTGDGPSAEKMRKNEKSLWTLVVFLVTLLVCYAGWMRSVERTPKPASSEDTQSNLMPLKILPTEILHG